MPDLVAIKDRQQQTWASGDWAMIAWVTVMVGELLCEAIDLHAGQQVLDVATGSGNTALAAARRWGKVTGIDYVPASLEHGRALAAVERLSVTFCEGDAERIPFPDASFDVVLSTFGAQFAPDQEQTARELLRVCRPGGKIGLANLTPESFSGSMAQAMGQIYLGLLGYGLPFCGVQRNGSRNSWGRGLRRSRSHHAQWSSGTGRRSTGWKSGVDIWPTAASLCTAGRARPGGAGGRPRSASAPDESVR